MSENKKKVTHILFSGLGGHGEYVFSLINNENADEVYLIFLGNEPLKNEYIESCKNLKISYKYVKKDKGVLWFLSILAYFFNNKKSTFIIHSNIAIIPLVFGRMILFYTQNKIIFVEHQANHLKTKVDWLCSYLAQMYSRHIVYLSENYMKQVMFKTGIFFRNKKTKIIRTGIDTSIWNRKENLPSEKIIIGMQGRMVPIKNFTCLIKAYKTLTLLEPHLKIELQLAGDGPDKSKLMKLAEELDLSSSVIFKGTLNKSDLHEYMSSLTIYVHSSVGETLSTALLQAMALKVPIIASDVNGINNMLGNETEALLFSENDNKELCDKILILITNPVIKDRLIQNAYNKLRQAYSLNKMRVDYQKLIASV